MGRVFEVFREVDFRLQVRNETYIGEIGVASPFGGDKAFDSGIRIEEESWLLCFDGCIEPDILIFPGRQVDCRNNDIGT